MAFHKSGDPNFPGGKLLLVKLVIQRLYQHMTSNYMFLVLGLVVRLYNGYTTVIQRVYQPRLVSGC